MVAEYVTLPLFGLDNSPQSFAKTIMFCIKQFLVDFYNYEYISLQLPYIYYHYTEVVNQSKFHQQSMFLSCHERSQALHYSCICCHYRTYRSRVYHFTIN